MFNFFQVLSLLEKFSMCLRLKPNVARLVLSEIIINNGISHDPVKNSFPISNKM